MHSTNIYYTFLLLKTQNVVAVAGQLKFTKNSKTESISAFASEVAVLPFNLRAPKNALALLFAKKYEIQSISHVRLWIGGAPLSIDYSCFKPEDLQRLTRLREHISTTIRFVA